MMADDSSREDAGGGGFWADVVSCIRKCTCFSGSATRAEFVRFLLFTLVTNAAMWLIATGIQCLDDEESLYYLNLLNDNTLYYAILGLWTGWLVISFSGLCSVSVRRLRAIRHPHAHE